VRHLAKYIFMLKVFFLPVLLTSCDEPLYYHIPEKDKPALKDGDTLVFSDSYGVYDTLVLALSHYYYNSDKRYNYETFGLQ
jgi:hypothetical protein